MIRNWESVWCLHICISFQRTVQTDKGKIAPACRWIKSQPIGGIRKMLWLVVWYGRYSQHMYKLHWYLSKSHGLRPAPDKIYTAATEWDYFCKLPCKWVRPPDPRVKRILLQSELWASLFQATYAMFNCIKPQVWSSGVCNLPEKWWEKVVNLLENYRQWVSDSDKASKRDHTGRVASETAWFLYITPFRNSILLH